MESQVKTSLIRIVYFHHWIVVDIHGSRVKWWKYPPAPSIMHHRNVLGILGQALFQWVEANGMILYTPYHSGLKNLFILCSCIASPDSRTPEVSPILF